MYSDKIPYWGDQHYNFYNNINNFIKKIKPIWHTLPDDTARPLKVRQLSVEAGLSGIDLPTDFGGQNLDLISHGIIYEESGRLDIDAREVIGSGHARIINDYGTIYMKQLWLPRVVEEGMIVGVGITEREAGSDIKAMKMHATSYDNSYVLNGTKSYISRVNEASAFIIFAKIDNIQSRSLSAFIVDSNLDGLERETISTMGMRGWSYGHLIMRNIRVDRRCLLGEEGDGMDIFRSHFSSWRVYMALLCLGAAQSTFYEVKEYIKKRKVFAKSVSSYSSVQQVFAEASASIQAARLLCYQSLWLGDREQPYFNESAMAKWYATEIAFNVVNKMMQLLGARGYTSEYSIEKRLRDIRGLMIADGSNDVLKSRVGAEILS